MGQNNWTSFEHNIMICVEANFELSQYYYRITN